VTIKCIQVDDLVAVCAGLSREGVAFSAVKADGYWWITLEVTS